MAFRFGRERSPRTFFWLGFVGTVACSPSPPPSSGNTPTLKVVVESDMAVPKDLDTVKVRVLEGSAVLFDETFPLGPGQKAIPLDVDVPGRLKGGASLRVQALSFQNNRVRVFAEGWTTLPEKGPRLVPLYLSYLCDGSRSYKVLDDGRATNACPDTTSCQGGACSSAEVGEALASDSRASRANGTGSPCIQVAPCFSSLAPLPLRLVGGRCLAYPSTPVSDATQVALVLKEGTAGFCQAGGSCYIPINPGPAPHQWQSERQTLVLPLGACSHEGVQGVAIASAGCSAAPASAGFCLDSTAESPQGPSPNPSSTPEAPPPSNPPSDGGAPPHNPPFYPTPPEDMVPYSCPTVPPDSSFKLGGSVTGLEESGLLLSLNRRSYLTLDKGTTHFEFPQALAKGERFAVEIVQDPGDRTICSVRGGVGVVVGDGREQAVTVSCAPRPIIRQLAGFQSGNNMCALLEGGAIRCWGFNSSGEISNAGLATSIAGLRPATFIAGGGAVHGSMCAVLDDTTVRCWGSDYAGKRAGSSEGTSIPGLSGVKAVAVGDDFACALLLDTTVRCWGSNVGGQTAGSSLTESIPGLSGVEQISSGFAGTCVLLKDRTVRCWGYQNAAKLTPGSVGDPGMGLNLAQVEGITASTSPTKSIPEFSDVRQVVVGPAHACVLLRDTTVRCWGSTRYNELAGSSRSRSIAGLSGVMEISSTSFTTCALLVTGKVRCWGGAYINNAVNGSSPTKDMVGLEGGQSLAVSEQFGCVDVGTGKLRCWGGPATSRGVFLPIDGLSGAIDVAGGGTYTLCARMPDLSLRCWGGYPSYFTRYYDESRNGLLSGTSSIQSYPGLTGVLQVSVGHNNACARLSDHTVRCWGENTAKEPSLPQSTTENVPGLSDVRQIVTSGQGQCAVMGPAGTLRCWGGVVPSSSISEDIPGLSGVAQVYLQSFENSAFGFALLQDSTVRPLCREDNNTLLAAGASLTRSIEGLTGVTKLAVGYSHACALQKDSSVRCWGDNSRAQTAGSTPTKSIPGLSGVMDIAAGMRHTCALMTNGSIRCWGDDSYGQLGGSTPSSPVRFINGAMAITAGSNYSCARFCDGTVLCWGSEIPGRYEALWTPPIPP